MAKGLGKGLGSLIPAKTPPAGVREEVKEIVEQTKSGILEVPTAEIVPNPHQPRKHFDHGALEELMSSIKIHGILNPLIVSPKDSSGKYTLIAGERRLRSAQTLGLKKVPVIIRDVKEQESLELAIIENIQRSNLNPMEEAAAYERLMNEFNLTQEEVGTQLGKSRSSVANYLRMLELPQEVQKAIASDKISVGHAKILAGLATKKEQQNYLDQILSNKMSVRELDQATKTKRKSRTSAKSFDPVREAQEELLRERLGTKAEIKKSGEKGQTVIHYYSQEELKRLLSELT